MAIHGVGAGAARRDRALPYGQVYGRARDQDDVAGFEQCSKEAVESAGLARLGAAAVEDIDVGVFDALPGRPEVDGLLGVDRKNLQLVPDPMVAEK